MRERNIYSRAFAQLQMKLRVHLLRAFLPAGAAARTFHVIYLPHLLQDADLKIAHKALDFLHFGISKESNVRMLGHINHLGRQDT